MFLSSFISLTSATTPSTLSSILLTLPRMRDIITTRPTSADPATPIIDAHTGELRKEDMRSSPLHRGYRNDVHLYRLRYSRILYKHLDRCRWEVHDFW